MVGATSGECVFVPTQISNLTSGVSAIAAGHNHACALTSGGGVLCWGSNSHGQIGDGSSGDYKFAPTQVSGLSSGVATITAGYEFTCARRWTGESLCWGSNRHDKLGNGANTDSPVPTAVSPF